MIIKGKIIINRIKIIIIIKNLGLWLKNSKKL